MKKIAWITDSTSGLSKDFIEKHNIHVIPLHVILDGTSYREEVDLTNDEFYEKLKIGSDAKTSQPAYGEFVNLYERLKEVYDCGIAVHASSELTGTYKSSINAAKQTGFEVAVVDSKMGAYALGKMIKNGIQLQEEGKSYEEIVDVVRSYPELAEMYLLPASFEQLKRSGRVSTSRAILASLLNIQLILGFDDGKVIVHSKIRSKRRAKQRFFELIHQAVNEHQVKELCVMHAGVKETAEQWKQELEGFHQRLKIKIATLVPVAGVHTGYGTMAVSWLLDGKNE
ncbi:MAG TPA: DegV family protein [Bacillota bacterium]|nr:DegV family protein [Bacillota bacterium]